MRIAVLLAVLFAVSGQAQTRAQALDVLPHLSDGFVLTPAAPSASRPVLIDSTTRADIMVTALSAELDVTLISPKNERYKIGQKRNDFESFISPVENIGANYRAILTNPTAGTWTLDVAAKSLSAPLDVIVNVFVVSPVFAAMVAGDIDYKAGDFAVVAMATFAGSAILHPATIIATLTTPSGAKLPVTFLDDGMEADSKANDGQYALIIELADTGEYAVDAVVTGTTAGVPFRRTASVQLRANKITAKLTGTFFDTAIDTDADGLFDYLTITPAIEIREAANYRVRVRLRSASRGTMERSMDVELSPGSVSPTLRFPARAMRYELGVDGPYEIEMILLERWTEGDVVLVDRKLEAGRTDAYRLADAQRDRLRLTGPVTATGIDTNGNGLFDQLKVTAEFETDVAAEYGCWGMLFDESYRYEEQVGYSCALVEGTNTIHFNFDGQKIGSTAAGDDFTVDLRVSGPVNELVKGKHFKIGRFNASSFEGTLPDTTPPSLIVTATPTTLWPPDHRMVEVIPEIRVTDNRDPAPVVRLESVTSNQPEDHLGDGATSPDIRVENGRIWLRAERDGSGERVYWITWSATDKSGNRMESPALVTVPHDRQQ